MHTYQHYHVAQSVPDALLALANAPGPAYVIAGGTDLLLDIEQGRHSPVHTLVDVSRVAEMTALEIRGDHLFVGAATALNRIAASPIVADHAMALKEACELIGGPQVRNTATLGGNVGHALPAADGAIALFALDAQALVADSTGTRWVGMPELYLGPGQSALNPVKEMLIGFRTQLRQNGQNSAFRRVMRPQGVAIAILNMGIWLQRRGDRITDVHVALGPSGPTPRRLRAAEAALIDRTPDSEALGEAAHALLEEASLRTSRHRAGSDYRKHLAGVLLADTVTAAWERAA
ncbi:MAG: FAD binding domain-containing protein [Caldilineales bacterium]|nr:FAD binding domain-containing protein [Caldilineales bacterium]